MIAKKTRLVSIAFVTVCLAGLLGLAACAPQQSNGNAAGNDADADAVQASFTWSYDSDCSMCHGKESSSLDDAACLAGTHAAEGTTCKSCHSDESGLSEVHKDATPESAKKRATRLRDTKIDESACSSCHGSYEELAAKTANLTVLTDSEGTIVNPHAMPENTDHAETDCSSCHVMHSDEPTTESAPAYCASCHHAGVYQCHTCHD